MTDNSKEFDSAFSTTDFDFVAFAMCQNDEHGKSLYRMVTSHVVSQREGRVRFAFVLAGNDMRPHVEELRELENVYMNGNGTVEPTTFCARRKQLRALLDRMKIRGRENNAPQMRRRS